MTTTNQSADPILDEIHRTRRKLLDEHGGIAGLAAFLRAQEAETERKVVGENVEEPPNVSEAKSRRPRTPSQEQSVAATPHK